MVTIVTEQKNQRCQEKAKQIKELELRSIPL